MTTPAPSDGSDRSAGTVAEAPPTTSTGHEPQPDRRAHLREILVVVIMAATAVLTAWSGFQASRWGSEMSLSSGASQAARIEATRLEDEANFSSSIQVALFTQWLQADAGGDLALADLLAERFPEPLATAFAAWQAMAPALAPATPFELAEYSFEARAQAAARDERAAELSERVLEANERADNYTLLTVAFALVLFFASMSQRLGSARAKWALLDVGIAGFAVCALLLLVFPKVW